MHTWTEGPGPILFQLQCLKSQSKEVVDVIMLTIRRFAWYAHWEATFSNDQTEGKKERSKNYPDCQGKKKHDTKLEPFKIKLRKTPDINLNATSIEVLISWSKEISEPPLTCFLSTLELTYFKNALMKVTGWP